ncbi:MAG: polysaccharide deacetylase family protein [archaeon]
MNRRNFLKWCVRVGAGLFIERIPKFANAGLGNKINIYLTIDDGPRMYMEKILNTLEDENPSTFFLIGSQINTNTLPVVYKALEKGHSVGNHSFTHPFFSGINLDRAKWEITKTHDVIENIYNKLNIKNPRLFRFPYGDDGGKNKRNIAEFLRENGYQTFFWDVDTEDWKYYSNRHKKSLNKIMHNCDTNKEGSIILAHDLGVTADYIIPSLIENEKYNLKKL